jgi:hypothetical protein
MCISPGCGQCRVALAIDVIISGLLDCVNDRCPAMDTETDSVSRASRWADWRGRRRVPASTSGQCTRGHFDAGEAENLQSSGSAMFGIPNIRQPLMSH